jgi:tungstate transport system ATP-binding protein
MLFTTTVYKNIEFGLNIRQVPKTDRPRIIEAALDLVGMRHFAHAPASKLSGGETQRVALARAIAISPKVLLCDEPTSSVDAENQIAILNILRQINREKKITVFFTTHDRFQAVSLANQILYLDHGRLTQTPSENIFSAVWTRTGEHQGMCDIQGAIRLNIPLERIGEKGKIRLMLHPDKLSLGAPHLDHDPGDSGNHPVSGRVVQITEENDNIRIVVDVGTRLTLLMSRETYVRNRTLVGEQVSVLIPPEGVEILSPG